MVTPKPVTVGHVIICPTRHVSNFKDLNELEVLELFFTAQEVAKKFEDQFRIRNYMYLIQDGTASGQMKLTEGEDARQSCFCLQLIPLDDEKSNLSKQFSQARGYDRPPAKLEEEAKRYRGLFESST